MDLSNKWQSDFKNFIFFQPFWKRLLFYLSEPAWSSTILFLNITPSVPTKENILTLHINANLRDHWLLERSEYHVL